MAHPARSETERNEDKCIGQWAKKPGKALQGKPFHRTWVRLTTGARCGYFFPPAPITGEAPAMTAFPPTRFRDLKDGFRQILSDPHWLAKVLLGGFLLINPFLVALAPAYFGQSGSAWIARVFPWILAFNVATFWFPLGFTYEVLRRARTGRGVQLPDWQVSRLGVFAREGAVKLTLAVFTLLLPATVFLGACYGLFIALLGLPTALFPMFVPPVLLVVIPFCAVACCRWLDGASVFSSALNYAENWRLFCRAWPDYLIASAFIVGVNAVTTAFFYTIPFGAVLGLCLVDTWFGPIYAGTVAREGRTVAARRERESILA
jgi:hypothetical protein